MFSYFISNWRCKVQSTFSYLIEISTLILDEPTKVTKTLKVWGQTKTLKVWGFWNVYFLGYHLNINSTSNQLTLKLLVIEHLSNERKKKKKNYVIQTLKFLPRCWDLGIRISKYLFLVKHLMRMLIHKIQYLFESWKIMTAEITKFLFYNIYIYICKGNEVAYFVVDS